MYLSRVLTCLNVWNILKVIIYLIFFVYYPVLREKLLLHVRLLKYLLTICEFDKNVTGYLCFCYPSDIVIHSSGMINSCYQNMSV